MVRRRGDGGFTLIELLIVIVILGILAAVVVFSVSAVKDKGAVSACRADITSIDAAAEAYYAQNGTGAPSLDALVTAGFIHHDSTITGSIEKTAAFTIVFTPGDSNNAGNADSSDLSGCPS